MIVYIIGKNYGYEGFSPCGVVETEREALIWAASDYVQDFYTADTTALPESYLVSHKQEQQNAKNCVK